MNFEEICNYPIGRCSLCGAQVCAGSFRDRVSLKEYWIGSHCQDCQDKVFLGVGNEDPPISRPFRRGVIVAEIGFGDDPREIALLPFLFVVPLSRIVYEPRHFVRAGPDLEPVDIWEELGAMRSDWREYLIRVRSVSSFTDALVRDRLAGCDLIIGLDWLSVRLASELCPAMESLALVDLCSEIPWREAYGLPLFSLSDFLRTFGLDREVGSADACSVSGLRQCVLIVRLLALRATMGDHVGRTAFELLLRLHADRFSESPSRFFGGGGNATDGRGDVR